MCVCFNVFFFYIIMPSFAKIIYRVLQGESAFLWQNVP